MFDMCRVAGCFWQLLWRFHWHFWWLIRMFLWRGWFSRWYWLVEVLNESPIADENSALSFDILFAVWADCNDGSICLQELCLRMLYSYTRSYMDIWEIMGMCVVIVFCFLKVVFPVHISFLKFVLSFRCKGASKGRECVLHRVPIQFLHRWQAVLAGWGYFYIVRGLDTNGHDPPVSHSMMWR